MRSPVSYRLIAGAALLALGAALFGLGIFHGFQNGSCSTTGYTAHYGPVPHCGKGVGWWMLILMAGLVIAGGAAALAGSLSAFGGPVAFVAIGVPFIALALGGGHGQLLLGASSSTGRISAGIFGACFVIGGVVWGVISGPSAISDYSSSSRVGGILASVVGVGLAFAIAAVVSGAIGTAAPTALAPASQAVIQSSGASRQTRAAVRHANAAIKQATSQAGKAEKLAACVTAAGADTAKIEKCTTKYTP